MILLQRTISFLIKKNTKLCLSVGLVFAKRFGGNNPAQIGKAVKDTVKIIGPHLEEAAVSQTKTQTPSTTDPSPTTVNKSPSTISESKPQAPTPIIIQPEREATPSFISLTGTDKITCMGEKKPDILNYSDKKDTTKVDVSIKESIEKKETPKKPSTSMGIGAVHATYSNWSSAKTFTNNNPQNEVKTSPYPIPSLIPKVSESPITKDSTPSIPKAPTLPSKPKVKSSSDTPVNHTEQIKQIAEMQNNPDQLNIKAILPLKKAPNGQLYHTTITAATTSQELTKEQLLEELKKRGLIKMDDGKTAVKVTLTDDTQYVLGNSKNKVKLTPQGQAYATYTSQKQSELNLLPKPKDEEASEFMIIIPPKSSEDLFIETGKQKHLIVVRTAANEYKALGYLTSKNSAEFLTHQQFVAFQKQQEGKDILTNFPKKQNMVVFNKPLIIEEKDIQRVKWDTEYINNFIKKKLTDIWDDEKDKPVNHFDKDGITEAQALEMCKACDLHSDQKKPHPQTPDQIQQQQKAKEKQQAQQALTKNTDNNKANEIPQ